MQKNKNNKLDNKNIKILTYIVCEKVLVRNKKAKNMRNPKNFLI